MIDQPWRLEFYQDDDGREPCREWMDKLPSTRYAALTEAFNRVLAVHGLGVCGSEWGKQLGEGLFEFRVRHSAPEIARMFGASTESAGSGHKGDVLLRVFCHAYGSRIILLLSGYDKGRHSDKRRQEREIKKARELLSHFKDRERKGRK